MDWSKLDEIYFYLDMDDYRFIFQKLRGIGIIVTHAYLLHDFLNGII